MKGKKDTTKDGVEWVDMEVVDELAQNLKDGAIISSETPEVVIPSDDTSLADFAKLNGVNLVQELPVWSMS